MRAWEIFLEAKFRVDVSSFGAALKGTGSWLGACALIKLLFSDLLVILSVNKPTHMYFSDYVL